MASPPPVPDLLPPVEDTTLVPYVSHLSMKEKLAAHIHIHLLFSPGQEETWTLLERQFPKASEKEFNSAVALLEMEDVISIDAHPHFPAEMLIKIDNSSAADPDAASVPLPFPGFRYPQLDTPLGTGTRHSAVTSASETKPPTPTRHVRFLPMSSTSFRSASASRSVSASSTKRARTSLGSSSSGVGSALGLQHAEADGGESAGAWGGWAEGAWSHTPPRLSDAVGEEDDLVDSLDETPLESPGQHVAVGRVVDLAAEDSCKVAVELDGRTGSDALLQLIEDHP